ncbi:MAG: VOC family protein [Azospirillum sp.]|nr:VOC family protein [Azospirillum sp.]
MIDHVSVGVADIERAKTFYDAALAPLGYQRMMDFGHAAGYGREHCQFWLGVPEEGADPGAGVHIAFSAPDRAAVDRFYQAALANGGLDNGAPGLRPKYHTHYYGAFVVDPDGNKIEACHHKPT